MEYDGGSFSGWQSQPHAPSIQDALNQALSEVAAEPVECVGAGRTDAGVHATGQVIHFESTAQRSLREWLLGINSNLTDDLAVRWVQHVSSDFHARFSALSRTYRYIILNDAVRAPLARRYAWPVRQSLRVEPMRVAVTSLAGEHDFSAFRASACQAKSPVRHVQHIDIERREPWLLLTCRANAFLHHMVRNIVGSLIEIGAGERDPQWLSELLASRDRRSAGMTAPPQGLCLAGIEYAPEFALETQPKFYW